MAIQTKTIITRIKNKVDDLSAWQSYTGTLLDGEIAVVRVPTGYTHTNPVTGAEEPVVELLMKVGDGTTTFANLPWMSAKASDVYNWAKAATVEFSSTDNKIYFKDAGGSAVANVDLSALSAKISALETGKLSDITVTQSGSGVVKSVEKDGTGKIKVTRATVATTDIANDAVTDVKIAASSVTKDKIADGAVTNAKLGTDISSDKINVGTGTTDGTLSKKLSTMDALIAANTSKLAGHTDSAINTLIDNKINALDGGTDSGTAGDDKYVSKVVQTNGKVATTYTSFPTAGTSKAGIVTLGASGGAATYDAVSTLSTQVETNKAEIANLKTSVAGGVHFIGVLGGPFDDYYNATDKTITLDGKPARQLVAGDIVIDENARELIWTGTEWEELGDVSRIGELESKINGLNVTAKNVVATTHKFVSQVTQSGGQVEVTYTQPTSADVSHGNSTVATKFEAIDAAIAAKANAADVYTKTETGTQISNAINALAFTAPSASGTTTSFIDSVSQTNGEISATKKNITPASTSATGIVKLSSAVDSTSEALAATPKAVKSAYDKAAAAAADAASRAPGDHTHGNITNDGALHADERVVVTDESNNITTSDITTSQLNCLQGIKSNIQTQLDGKAASSHGTHVTYGGDGSASTVSRSDHTHGTYEAAIAAIEADYVKFVPETGDTTKGKLYVGKTDTKNVIIFDCGGAADL